LRVKTDITKSSSRSADARMLHVCFLNLRRVSSRPIRSARLSE
jgi:hypothetical protein